MRAAFLREALAAKRSDAAIGMTTNLEKFLNLPPGKKMKDADFEKAKEAFRNMRAKHVRSLFSGQFLDSSPWLLKRGAPDGPPDASLLNHHVTRGGSVLVAGVSGPGFMGTTTFEKGDMITDAYDIARTRKEKLVGVLNMANAHAPGGGFLHGSRAQEEQLCHRSDLFPRLKLHRYFAGGTMKFGYIAAGTCLVTPNVDILRRGKEHDKEHGKEPYARVDPMRVTVLSAAAKEYASIPTKAEEIKKNLEDLKKTWKAVITGANAAGVEVLIVGALGCGAFKNPPENVGRALAAAQAECDPGSKLEEVRVVIMEDHNSASGGNFTGFKKGFDAQQKAQQKAQQEAQQEGRPGKKARTKK